MNPGDIPAGLGALPVELNDLMSFQQYNFTMGLTGMLCGLLIWIIWSQSL